MIQLVSRLGWKRAVDERIFTAIKHTLSEMSIMSVVQVHTRLNLSWLLWDSSIRDLQQDRRCPQN
jgi:hypothetical protein